MALDPGTCFGAYEITGELGVGGMGEVYRATDTTLERDVAIKILPEAFSSDADRVARFEQEAKTLAALNHPNIAQIHGLEKTGGTTAIVMELVEGPTLADRIEEGPIPADEALGIAYQIADALEAAHERQVVHRDLKPANVKLRPDGTVKVLDFGIAKVLETQAGISGPQAPSLTTPAMTQAGILLGTAAYMSPEQARGKPVDRRADIWAFGCVLYEMLTGQPAFGGEDVPLTLARILAHGTDMESLPGVVSPAVRHTIAMCLEKDPRKRIADIGDVRLALQGRFETPLPRAVQAAARQPFLRRAMPVVAAVLGTTIVFGAAGWMLWPAPSPREVRRSIHTIPAEQPLNGAVPVIAVSPDGGRIAYAAGGALWVRPLNELDGRQVPGTGGENPIVPVFSPDGEWILYGRPGGPVKRVSVDGGTPIPVIQESPSLGWRWDDDNMIRYATDCRISQVPATGGAEELIVDESDSFCVEPTLLPGSDRLLYERRVPAGPEIVIHSLARGERTVLFPGKQPLYLEPGYIVYFDLVSGLMARRFDLETLEYSGPVALVNDILTLGQSVHFRISRTGTLVYMKGEGATSGQAVLVMADETGNIEQLDVPARDFKAPSVSPASDEVAVQVGNGDNAQIFLYDLSGANEPRQLTFEGGNQQPVWTPDGEWITYSSNRDGRWRIFRQRADGSGVAEALTEPADDGAAHIHPAWAPDGERLAYTEVSGASADIWIVSVPDGAPEILVGGEGNQSWVAFAPNGEAIAYWSSNAGAFEVLAEPFPPDGSRTRISEAGVVSAYPVWSRDSTRLSFQTGGGGFVAVDIATKGFTIRNRRELPFVGPTDARRLDSMPDGNRMLVTVPPGQADSNLLARDIVIVENWIEELEQRVPTD